MNDNKIDLSGLAEFIKKSHEKYKKIKDKTSPCGNFICKTLIDKNGFLIYSNDLYTTYDDIKAFYKTEKNEKNLFRFYYFKEIKNINDIGERVVIVMMNPAFADSTEDDDTIENIKDYLSIINKKQNNKYKSFEIINLFPIRMPKDENLNKLNEKIEEIFPNINSDYQKFVCSYLESAEATKIVAAWGCKYHKTAKQLFCSKNIKFYCYGKNRDGSPRHFSNQAYRKKDNPFDDFKEYKF